MGLKKFKPITPGRRTMTVSDFAEITTHKPHKKLTSGKKRISGRSGSGAITTRRRGGGHKKRYRHIDFKRDKQNILGKVETIEYDPNRSARIALISYADGEKRYILAPRGLKTGDSIEAGSGVKANVGNCLPLEEVQLGADVHNIELKPGCGGKLVRAGGQSARVMAKEGKYVMLKLPSREVRKILKSCRATIGQLSNIDGENIVVGKAGRSRWLNHRPKVRGVVMNPVDHPHGGGEGKTSGGRHPVTPQGVSTKGFKTRRKNKYSNDQIMRRRKK